jgi:2-C-methyl-D-erythritol 2,4-cyclodiphosphate synthase
MRVGLGYDAHRLVAGRPLILGGVEIPHPQGLLGHSDADVLSHAIGDALLGAVGAGDLGTHFPDRDPAYKDISSLILLERIMAMVRGRGFVPVNVDATVVVQEPRLAPHIPAMQAKLAPVLGLTPPNRWGSPAGAKGLPRMRWSWLRKFEPFYRRSALETPGEKTRRSGKIFSVFSLFFLLVPKLNLGTRRKHNNYGETRLHTPAFA